MGAGPGALIPLPLFSVVRATMASTPSGDVEGGDDDGSRSGRSRGRDLLGVDYESSSSEGSPLSPWRGQRAGAAAPPAAPFGSRSIQAEGTGNQPDEEEPPSSCRAGKASAAARSPSAAAVVPTNAGDDTYGFYLLLLLLSFYDLIFVLQV